MKLLVDTNIPVIANDAETDPCGLECETLIREIIQAQKHVVVLDEDGSILTEYARNLRRTGEPGIGDAFVRWVVDNEFNPERCERVLVTQSDPNDECVFEEFPQSDPALATFDRSDRKWVAVALTHPDKPPIHYARDRGWPNHKTALEAHGVVLVAICER